MKKEYDIIRRCISCGRLLPIEDFKIISGRRKYKYRMKTCKSCHREHRAEKRHSQREDRIKDGVRYDFDRQRLIRYENGRKYIYWSPQMISTIRKLYPVTENAELAGILNVSVTALYKKAKSLCIKKDAKWIYGEKAKRMRQAQISRRRMGNPGAYAKGNRKGSEVRIEKCTRP